MDEPAMEGVGERLKWSTGLLADSENERERKEWVDEFAGRGVETPSALASLASRCGGNGDFGGRHVGDKLAEIGDKCEDRGVPFPFSFTLLDMMGSSQCSTN
jgi:hypothetical protein